VKRAIHGAFLIFVAAGMCGAIHAGCEECMSVVRNSDRASHQMIEEAMNCAARFDTRCQTAVKTEIFRRFRVIVDFFPRY